MSLFKTADYENELVYYSAQELMQLGLGGAAVPNLAPGGKMQGGPANYKDVL